MIKTTIQLMAVACAFFLGLTVAAAPQKGNDKPVSLIPQPKSNEEIAAFNTIACKVPMVEGEDKKLRCPANQKSEPAAILAAADAFLKTFPASKMLAEVYAMKMDAYLSTKTFDKAVDELERALAFMSKYREEKTKESADKTSKELQDLLAYHQNNELQYYQQIMQTASNANQTKYARYFGDEILKRVPTHYPTLLTVARTAVMKLPADPKEKTEQLEHAEEIGQMAVNYVMAYIDGPQSAELKPAERDDLAYRAHSVMGLIYLQKENYPDAQKAYLMALSLKKEDPQTYYYLGYAYYKDKPSKADAAIDALQKSAFLKGVTEQNSLELLGRIYEDTKRPVADMEKDVKAAGARLGK